MNYQETIQYLYNSTPVFEKIGAGAYKDDLHNTHLLDEHFNHPHRRYQTIHVAGTNGKGSVSHTLAAMLQASGLKVGLYTSPHLVDFRERIRVDGKCIEESYVVDFVEKEKIFFEPLSPSFFELTTAMAFKYFADREVDVAVIEVGLGGRLDCTNVITPRLSIITNISLDHTMFLGDTLAQIAGEKAGVIKFGVPVVIGETVEETKGVFLQKAHAMHAPIIFPEEEIMSPLPLDDFELKGDYQVHNLKTILCAARQLGISPFHIKEGLQNVSRYTGLMGRWQTLQTSPTVVCDTGHNVAAWQYLCPQLRKQECHRMRIVFGMVDDKDYQTVMTMLPKEAEYYFTKADTHRAVSEKEIKRLGDSLQLKSRVFANVCDAFGQALADADKDDFIFVGGSSYIVANLLTHCQTLLNTGTAD